MKNKLKKNQRTKFDYTMRKLGVLSLLLFVVSFGVLLPLSQNIQKENIALNQNIDLLTKEEEQDFETPHVPIEQQPLQFTKKHL